MRQSNLTIHAVGLLLLLAVAACGGDDELPLPEQDRSGSGADAGATVDASTARPADAAHDAALDGSTLTGEDPFASCTRGELESDFQAAPLRGPAVLDGKLASGSYVISATYLQLRQEPASQQTFGELMTGIMTELEASDGLEAISLGTSARCGVARTLSVWRDDVAMLGFVTSRAHTAAITAVNQVSRGGSLVTHWTGNEQEATWPSAAQHAASEDGPFY